MSGLAGSEWANPTASCPEVDPSIGAPDRMSGMGKCQAVKAGVLSRWKSHVPKDMARGDIGTAERQIGVEARSALQPEEFGKLRLVVRAKGIGAEARKGSRVESSPSLSVKHCQLSGDVPDARLGRWPNKPLQGHRVAIVSVACQKAGKPRGLKAQWLYATCLTGLG